VRRSTSRARSSVGSTVRSSAMRRRHAGRPPAPDAAAPALRAQGGDNGSSAGARGSLASCVSALRDSRGEAVAHDAATALGDR
jgi:hypothetical protein